MTAALERPPASATSGALGADAIGRPLQILLVGVGGQGVLTAAQVLTAAVHRAGMDVVSGQLHGMSQRGGSVECSVRIGPVRGSFILGPADIIVAFEPLEGLRSEDRIGPASSVLLSLALIVPTAFAGEAMAYPAPADIEAALASRGAHVFPVDAQTLAKEAGAERTMNVVMLGALAGLGRLPFAADVLLEEILSRCPPAFAAANRRAFEAGRKLIRPLESPTIDSPMTPHRTE